MGKRISFQRVKAGYVRLIEGQGFPIVAVVCVAVITATALWTNHQEDDAALPTPTAAYDVTAAQLQQQLLRDALSATAAPTAAPQQWRAPLAGEVQQPFSADSMVQSGITGIWSMHDAIDIAAPLGSEICAMADGTVLSAGEDALQGAWLLIDHRGGTLALYAGMSKSAEYRAGDSVRFGDVIGFCGSGLLSEQDASPHLHLRVTQNGAAIDPQSLWAASAQ